MDEIMVKNDNNYGSISVKNDEVADNAFPLEETRARGRTPSLALMFGALALVAAFFLVTGRNSEVAITATSPETAQELVAGDVPILGKIHRVPSDIPHLFSQRVDHFDPENQDTFQNRYYKKTEYWKGPGHPIFLIVGGEGSLDGGMFYPFVDTYLAKKFGAFVIHVEHRFYGQSQPIDPVLVKNSELAKYHTAHQALKDHIVILKTYQEQLGCSRDKKSKKYCPVMSVGGSYPGFLSALMRQHYDEYVDIGYASSAPLRLYAMEADQFGYMEKVTNVTDKASLGCAEAVRETLAEVDELIRAAPDHVAFAHNELNVCPYNLPNYITSNDLLSKEIMMIVEYTFADWVMGFYPPEDPDTDLAYMCGKIFQNETLDSLEKMTELWHHLDNIDDTMECFDMTSQMPDGPYASISGADWSGIGYGYDGDMFDFHCCATLTPQVGFSHKSMFPYRKWTLEWLTDHCVKRFDVVPDPYKLVREFKFNNLAEDGVTRVLFTNGMNDIWMMGSYLESLSDSIIAVNIPSGAHHSELNHYDEDTYPKEVPKDMVKAHAKITRILDGWFDDIFKKMKH